MPGWGGREVAPRRGGFEVAPASTQTYPTQLLVNRAKTACSAPRACTHRLAAPSTENLTQTAAPRLQNPLPMGGEGGSPCGPTAVSWDPATARRPPGAIVSWPKKWAAKGAAVGARTHSASGRGRSFSAPSQPVEFAFTTRKHRSLLHPATML